MIAYPQTPPGWMRVGGRAVGPFTTHATYRQPDGGVAQWSSRHHRKHRSRLSRARKQESVWWAPHRASWWIGVLFSIGASCFFIGPFPGFAQAVGSAADAAVFLVGSIFFTTAAGMQCLETFNADQGPVASAGPREFRSFVLEPRRIDWWASLVQFVGTVAFNVTTFRALQTSIDNAAYDRLVWVPDAFGSVCFLVAGYLAYVEVCGRIACLRGRDLEWQIAAVNLLGCIAFGISPVASYVVPSTGSVVDLAAANFTTALGGLCFLVGAVLLLPEGARSEA